MFNIIQRGAMNVLNTGSFYILLTTHPTITVLNNLPSQLTRVNDPRDLTAGANGTTWLYSYNIGGNIIQKRAYAYTTGTVGTAAQTTNYLYGDNNWKDKLTSYDGITITYDAIGNPLNDGTWTYTWNKGRQLKKMVRANETVQFTYNEDGLRVQKTATNSGTTKYTLHGKNIVHLVNGTQKLHFYYDTQNKPALVLFNSVPYYYLYNLQGDVVALVDGSGTKVVEYYYDAWGKLLSKAGTLAGTLGTLNPFRYRGYVYDEETGLYYLNARYYNCCWARFISCDELISYTGERGVSNIYSYCNGNPISFSDSTGYFLGFSLLTIVTTAVVGAIISAGTQIITNVTTGKEWSSNVLGAAIGGAVYNTVGLLSYGNTALAAYTSAAAESFTNEVVSYTPLAGEKQKEITFDNVCNSLETIVTDTAINGTEYFVTGKIADKFMPVTSMPNSRKRHFKTIMRTEWGKQSFKQTLVQGEHIYIFNGIKIMLLIEFEQ